MPSSNGAVVTRRPLCWARPGSFLKKEEVNLLEKYANTIYAHSASWRINTGNRNFPHY